MPSLPESFSQINRKFGIEIEVFGLNKDQAAHALNRNNIECYAENYNHRTNSYWKATTDSSIVGTSSSEDVSVGTCELVSPPLLLTEESLEEVAKVIRVLKEAGAKVNETCGIHVHVDCRQILSPDFYRLLLTFYSENEDKIDQFIHESRRENKNRFCHSSKNIFETWTNIWTEYPNMSNRIPNMLSGIERYYKLNFCSYTRHGTVEFRQLHGSLNESEIINWIVFCVNLVQNVKNFLGNKNNSRIVNTRELFSNGNPYPEKTFKNYFTALVQRAVTTNATLASAVRGMESSSFEDILEINEKLNIRFNDITKSYVNTKTNHKTLNQYFRFYIVLISNFLHLAANNARIANVINSRYLFARDSSLRLEDIHQILIDITSIIFSFTGNFVERRRKFYAKIKNLGIQFSTTKIGILDFIDQFEMESFQDILVTNILNVRGGTFQYSRIPRTNKFYSLWPTVTEYSVIKSSIVNCINDLMNWSRPFICAETQLNTLNVVQNYMSEYSEENRTNFTNYIGFNLLSSLVKSVLHFRFSCIVGETSINDISMDRTHRQFINAYNNQIAFNHPYNLLEPELTQRGIVVDKKQFVDEAKIFFEENKYNTTFEKLFELRENNPIVFD